VNASTVAVADTLGHRVVVVDIASGQSRSIGVGTLNGPSSVAFAADGSIVVSELGSADVRRFAIDGTLLQTIGSFGGDAGEFRRPRCVRFDGAGALHVADMVGGFVSIFDANLAFHSRVSPTLANGAPAAPRWISTGPDGSLHYDLIPASAS
jgi:DNA-binding beta-propeller fold protein YncE